MTLRKEKARWDMQVLWAAVFHYILPTMMGWKAWNQELRQIFISLSDFSLVFCYSKDKSNDCLPINTMLWLYPLQMRDI